MRLFDLKSGTMLHNFTGNAGHDVRVIEIIFGDPGLHLEKVGRGQQSTMVGILALGPRV